MDDDPYVQESWDAIDKLARAIADNYALGTKVAEIFRVHIIGRPIPTDETKYISDFKKFWNAIYDLNVVEFSPGARKMIEEDYTKSRETHPMVIGTISQRLASSTRHPEIVAVNNLMYSIYREARIPYRG